MKKDQKYYGKIVKFDEAEKYVESIILHFDTSNENQWLPLAGSLDNFLERLRRAKKNIPACYQHDDEKLIGQWRDIVIENNMLKGRCYLDDIPFVREVVIPQLKSGTLQGSSPTISPVKEAYNRDKAIWEIIEGVLCEVSLVGLPADLRADIIQMKASIDQTTRKELEDNFNIELLTL